MPNRIKTIRKERGLTLEQLGEAMGTSKGQAWKLEVGDVQLTENWLKKLSKALDCTIAEITGELLAKGVSKSDLDFLAKYKAATDKQRRIIAELLDD